jgi:hypothetical protein
MSFVRRQRRSYLCCVGGHHRFRDSGPKRLRASGRDGGTVMTRPRHPSQCSFPVIQVAARPLARFYPLNFLCLHPKAGHAFFDSV